MVHKTWSDNDIIKLIAGRPMQYHEIAEKLRIGRNDVPMHDLLRSDLGRLIGSEVLAVSFDVFPEGTYYPGLNWRGSVEEKFRCYNCKSKLPNIDRIFPFPRYRPGKSYMIRKCMKCKAKNIVYEDGSTIPYSKWRLQV